MGRYEEVLASSEGPFKEDPTEYLDWLERADEAGCRMPPGVPLDSEFGWLADDPRFRRISERLQGMEW